MRSIYLYSIGKELSKINLNQKLEKLKFLLSLLICIYARKLAAEPLLDKVIKLHIKLDFFSQYFPGLVANPGVRVMVGEISLN